MYYIAYGTKTRSIEQPDQLILLPLPDHTKDMDSTELESFIAGHWPSLKLIAEHLVGLDSLMQAVQSIGLDEQTEQEVLEAITDAANNLPY